MKPNPTLTMLACAVCALVLLTHPTTVSAEGGGPPPPSIAPGAHEIRVPKAVLNRYLEQVHPAYIEWLGDGPKDCLPVFELFLTSTPATRFERDCFVLLYLGHGR